MDKANWPRGLAFAAAVAIGAMVASPLSALAQEASRPFAGGAAAQLRFRAIKVDVTPLAEIGLSLVGEWMAADLPNRLQAYFSTRLAPRDAAAPILLVRIDRVRLGDSGGGGTQPFGLGGARDDIEGVASVVAAGGKVLASYPLFATQIALTGGPIYERGTERRRVADLANSFAYWLPGQMGL
jgi:hypothetical protein